MHYNEIMHYYEIRHFNGNPTGKWPTFPVRELRLHPDTERVSPLIASLG